MAIPIREYPDYMVKENGSIWSNILRVAHGDRKTAGGYIWRREEG